MLRLQSPLRVRISLYVYPEGYYPPGDTLDEINYRSVIVGFPMLSAGIFTGAVWAHYAWGSLELDPKETWSLSRG